jgi:dTDP-glucose 4,6-dehydratase
VTAGAARDTLLVTGGAGFIGTNLVRHLLSGGERRVVVLDLLTYAGRRENLADFDADARFAFVAGSISDRGLVDALLARERPRAILHLAAETHVDRSIDDPRPFVETNVNGSFALLEAARRHFGQLAGAERDAFRFVHVSTDEVYGSMAPGACASETTALAPSSPYAASKAASDQLALAWQHTFGLPVLVTNCSNNFGPYQFPEKLIPLMLRNALEGRPLPIYGDGGNVRDWLFVEDHCEALVRVLEAGRPGQRYNIGAQQELTNRELVARLCAALELERPARANPALLEQGVSAYEALVHFVADRPGHDRRYALDADKLRRELGWEPRFGFDDALRRTVRWYLERPAWGAEHDRRRLGVAAGGRA